MFIDDKYKNIEIKINLNSFFNILVNLNKILILI
jgi:hypothetical protein